jgi:hypothetical protein
MPTEQEMKEYTDFLLGSGSTSNAELEKIANEMLATGQAPSAVEESRAIGKQIASALIEELKQAGFSKLADDPSINPEVTVESNVDKKIKPEEVKPKAKGKPANLVEHIMNTIGAVADTPDKHEVGKEDSEGEDEDEIKELVSKLASELEELGIPEDEIPEATEELLAAYAEAIANAEDEDSDEDEDEDELIAEGSELDEQTMYYLLGQEVGQAIVNKLNE